MRKQYCAPVLMDYGSIATMTRASFNNSQEDAIFFAGQQVGTAQGSLDACVSENPQSPSGTCKF